VKNTQVEIVMNYQNNSTMKNDSTQYDNNYELLQGIEVPNELGLEDLNRLEKYWKGLYLTHQQL
jgi:hypothetical protein